MQLRILELGDEAGEKQKKNVVYNVLPKMPLRILTENATYMHPMHHYLWADMGDSTIGLWVTENTLHHLKSNVLCRLQVVFPTSAHGYSKRFPKQKGMQASSFPIDEDTCAYYAPI